jgi:ubiquitin-conjugating enzyme E2 O
MMQDATGQTIYPFDLVMSSETSGGAHHGRGIALKALPGGKKLSVRLVDGTEVTKNACDVTVVDRSYLYPGMAVASVSDHTRQPGVITGVTMALDLARVDDGDEPTVVATGVSLADVRPVNDLTEGDYVVSGPWLGRVLELSVDVDVLFDDGRSVCRVANAGDKLRVVGNRFWRKYKNAFCPGDGVVAAADADASVFKASRWLRGHWKPSHGEGTVAKVEMGGVLVDWVASLHLGTDMHAVQASAPPAYQANSHNLTFFCPGWFWGVSLRCFLHRANDKKRRRRHRHRLMKRVHQWRRRRRLTEFERTLGVAGCHTTVDVLWQDGTRHHDLPSASLHRIQVRNEQDFFPGQRVTTKMLSPPPVAAAAGRVGIVKSLDYKDQTVCVSWITGGESSEVDDAVTTVMSTYDLERSPDHRFFYGDIVVRLRPTTTFGSTTAVVEGTKNDLSWVGHIVGLSDAHYLDVKWGDGSTSQVHI